MDWTLLIAGGLVVWSTLRVLGNERQRRLEVLVAEAAAVPARPIALPPGQTSIPVVS